MRNIPIIMDASVTVPRTTIVQLNDESRLRTPCRRGMLLDEIRIIPPEHTDNNAMVKFRFRNWDLTNDWVSMGFLGPRMTSLTTYGSLYHVNWRLPKPLYVPPGEYVIPSINNPSGVATSYLFRIAYLGRELPDEEPIPDEVTLPFIGNYTALAGTDGQVYQDESKSNQLCNPFSEPLYVYRMMGGTRSIGRSFIDTTTYRELLKVSIMNSRGDTIVRDPTPFQHLFPQRGPGWLVKTVLQSSEYWRVKLYSEAAGSTGAPEVNMFGYHTVKMTRM